MKVTSPLFRMVLLAPLLLVGCGSSEEKKLSQVRRDSTEGNYASAYQNSREVLDSDKGLTEQEKEEIKKAYEEASKKLVASYVSTIIQKINDQDYLGAVELYTQAINDVPETAAAPVLNRRMASVYAILKDWSSARGAFTAMTDSTDSDAQTEGRTMLEKLDEYERLQAELETLRPRVEVLGSTMGIDFGSKENAPDCQMMHTVKEVPEEQREDLERFFTVIDRRNSLLEELQQVPPLPVTEAS